MEGIIYILAHAIIGYLFYRLGRKMYRRLGSGSVSFKDIAIIIGGIIPILLVLNKRK